MSDGDGRAGLGVDELLAWMRGVLAGHAADCGPRAPQLMVNDRLYPDAIEDWIAAVEALRAQLDAQAGVVAAARDYLAPDQGPIPAPMRDSPYGRLLLALREYDAARRPGAGEGE